MFRDYWYRSGVTATMRWHLGGLAEEAIQTLKRKPERVLDIGMNDGTLLSNMPEETDLYGIDPCAVPADVLNDRRFHRVANNTYPHPCLHGKKFDLIFTVACLYDVDDPLAFARAVKANLAPDGLWCVEVSSLSAIQAGAWDGVCHEHLCYYDALTLLNVLERAGLRAVKVGTNDSNGGSIRIHATHDDLPVLEENLCGAMPFNWDRWSQVVRDGCCRLRDYLEDCHTNYLKVHLLGASTKANTWLQACGANPTLIQAASDRDPRKHGRRTPGTDIPIVSEEESRGMQPDVYIVGPWHFRNEIVTREKEFLESGGRLVLPLPRMEVVKK
jgi:hypothetical protein